MRYTENLNLKLPDDNDSYDQEHMNYNMEIVDKKINGLIPYWGTYETFPRPPLEDDINKIFIDISTNDPRLMYTWNTEENEYAPTGGSGKADGSSVDIPLTLPAAGWTGTAAPYSQTVTVPQMRVGMTPLVTLTDTDGLTDAQRYAFSLLTDYDTVYAQMTFYAADLPTVDIPVTLKGIPAQEMEFVDNTVVLIVEPSGFTLSTDPEYENRYVSTIPCEGMSAGAEGGSWDIVRSGPVLTLEESEIAAHITDVKCLDGAVMIVCTEVPAQRYLLKISGTYKDAAPGDVILPNIQGYLDKVDELEEKAIINTSGITQNEYGIIPLNNFSSKSIGRTGMYYIIDGKDFPPGVSSNGYCLCMAYGTAFRMLIYVPYGTTKMYIIQMANGVWSEWEQK